MIKNLIRHDQTLKNQCEIFSDRTCPADLPGSLAMTGKCSLAMTG
jgi:hypothetical protein